MAEDIGPGTLVEVYRGKALMPEMMGMRFIVLRAWKDDDPCSDCIPGFNAPAIELLDFPVKQPPGTGPLCGCCFRPVNRGPGEAIERARALEDA